MSAGDLRFYHTSGDLQDNVIALTSGGMDAFVHVEIDMGDGSAVGEIMGGLRSYPIPSEPPGRVVLFDTSASAGAATLANALLWARHLSREGLPYGWEDILNAGIAAGIPAMKDAPYIGVPGAYDCSDFVTRFLLAAGVELPDTIASEPHTVTPQMLAQALGVA